MNAETCFQPRTEVPLHQAQLGRVFTDDQETSAAIEDLIGTKFFLYTLNKFLGKYNRCTWDSQTVSTNSFLLSSALGSITISGDITPTYQVTLVNE